ncbi:type II secretion system protein [Uliginosibacterium flavum]|uniref:Prepilin-type N-terminal cleavage/methylation domain-containing protein n=1 Tax=Uliginosibacterium flavum TaxID=1396831 RepID=A0ABV2TIC4_9RHOO
MHQRGRGFTLIEIVIVVAIIGILVSVAVPVASLVNQRARESELRLALRQIRSAIDAYKEAADAGLIAKGADESGYPRSLDELVGGKADITQASGRQIYFLRRLPRDPMNPERALPAASTWGQRSYASPPDNPQAGKDVFDVYSLSDKVGLNDVAFREW